MPTGPVSASRAGCFIGDEWAQVFIGAFFCGGPWVVVRGLSVQSVKRMLRSVVILVANALAEDLATERAVEEAAAGLLPAEQTLLVHAAVAARELPADGAGGGEADGAGVVAGDGELAREVDTREPVLEGAVGVALPAVILLGCPNGARGERGDVGVVAEAGKRVVGRGGRARGERVGGRDGLLGVAELQEDADVPAAVAGDVEDHGRVEPVGVGVEDAHRGVGEDRELQPARGVGREQDPPAAAVVEHARDEREREERHRQRVLPWAGCGVYIARGGFAVCCARSCI